MIVTTTADRGTAARPAGQPGVTGNPGGTGADRGVSTGGGPATGETIQIKAKRVVKFRVAKAAKDAILGAK